MGKRDAEATQLGLPVRSGLYEVDLLLRLMTPGYWPEAQHRVSRGTWFVEKGHDWVPLKETVRRPDTSARGSARQCPMQTCESATTASAVQRVRQCHPCLDVKFAHCAFAAVRRMAVAAYIRTRTLMYSKTRPDARLGRKAHDSCRGAQVADELENAYRSEVWNPAYSHLRDQKQGIRAARVELTSSSVKARRCLSCAYVAVTSVSRCCTHGGARVCRPQLDGRAPLLPS